ncbi:MAG: ribosome recycling factor, partial [Deinococcus sp.]|nr:ribosome recycling factor [Deinococcus sp.]
MLKDLYRQVASSMHKAVEALEANLAVLRTSRASPGLLSRVMVAAYGSQLPLAQVASITTPDPRTLSI